MDDLTGRIARLTPEQRRLLNLRMQAPPRDAGSRTIPRRQGDGSTAPLSAAQRRLWFLHQLSPGDTAYSLPAAFRIRGPLDAEALERSLNAIIERHDMLRTAFEDREPGPVQVVHRFRPHPLKRTDLSESLSPERAVENALREKSARPFDLTHGPLIRFHLFRLGDSDHVLYLNAHHIICDEWSIAVFGNEISALYPAFAAGLPPPLAPLDVQFGDEFGLDVFDFLLDLRELLGLSRRVVSEINKLKECHGFLRGLVSLVGFAQAEVAYERAARHQGAGKVILLPTMQCGRFRSMSVRPPILENPRWWPWRSLHVA
jgi:hypothetical protein